MYQLRKDRLYWTGTMDSFQTHEDYAQGMAREKATNRAAMEALEADAFEESNQLLLGVLRII